MPYRWSQQFASLFVPFDAVRVEIPVRAPSQEVDVVVDGMEHHRYMASDRWTTITIHLSPSGMTMPHRITFRADSVFQRPQPAVRLDGRRAPATGTRDVGEVGIQVGQERVERDAMFTRRLARCE